MATVVYTEKHCHLDGDLCLGLPLRCWGSAKEKSLAVSLMATVVPMRDLSLSKGSLSLAVSSLSLSLSLG